MSRLRSKWIVLILVLGLIAFYGAYKPAFAQPLPDEGLSEQHNDHDDHDAAGADERNGEASEVNEGPNNDLHQGTNHEFEGEEADGQNHDVDDRQQDQHDDLDLDNMGPQ